MPDFMSTEKTSELIITSHAENITVEFNGVKTIYPTSTFQLRILSTGGGGGSSVLGKGNSLMVGSGGGCGSSQQHKGIEYFGPPISSTAKTLIKPWVAEMRLKYVGRSSKDRIVLTRLFNALMSISSYSDDCIEDITENSTRLVRNFGAKSWTALCKLKKLEGIK